VSPLHHVAGYAVQIAAEAALVPSLIPVIKEEGGSDIVVTAIKQLVA
jgi:ATP phosphoribosyltransferase